MESERRRQPGGRVPPSEAVVTAVARQTDVAPTHLPPLHDVIDPDALDALFAPTPTAGRMDGGVSFEYSGYEFTVHAHGYVETSPVDP